jgi:hypothetical protein
MSQDLERPTQNSSPSSSGSHDLEWREKDPRGQSAPSKPRVMPTTRLLIAVRNIFGKIVPKQTVTARNPSTGQVFSPFRSGDGWVADIFGKVGAVKISIEGRDANGDYADDSVVLRVSSEGKASVETSETFFNWDVRNEGGTKPARVRVAATMTRLKEVPLSDVTDTNGKGRNFQESKKVPCVPSPRSNLMNNFRLQFGSTAEHEPSIRVFDVVHLPAPFRIGVAVRKGVTRPKKILMFFHPPARGAGATVADPYPTAFNDIMFRYLSGNSFADKHLAYQLSESGRDFALVFPLGNVSNGMGVFDKDHVRTEEVFLEVLAHFRRRFDADFKLPAIEALMLASFSSGIGNTLSFLRKGGKLLPLVKEIYDYDGAFSTFNVGKKFPPSYAPILRGNGRRALIYTQNPTAGFQNLIRIEREFPLPYPRWKNVRDPIPPPSAPAKLRASAIHQLIPRYMLFHSLTLTNE